MMNRAPLAPTIPPLAVSGGNVADVVSCGNAVDLPVVPSGCGGNGSDGNNDVSNADAVTISEEDAAEDCSICLMPLDNGEVTLLQCGHQLHRDCVNRLRGHLRENAPAGFGNMGVCNAACPLCRRPLDLQSDPAQVALRVMDDDLDTAVSAARTLGLMKQRAAPHAAVLVSRLRDNEVDMRRVAVWALRQIGGTAVAEHAADVAECLGDFDMGVRWYATEVLLRMGELGAAALADKAVRCGKDEVCQLNAAATLSKMGLMGASALASHLADKDQLIRQRAAIGIGQIGKAGGRHAGALAALLRDEDAEVRRTAATALSNFDVIDVEAHLGVLASLLQDKEASVRRDVAEAIGRLGRAGAPHIQALLDLLSGEEQNKEVRSRAGQAVAQIGAACAAAQKNSHTTEDHRWLFPDEGKVALARLLRDKDDGIRTTTVGALKQMSSVGAAVLASQIDQQDVLGRGACVEALRRMGWVGAAALASQLQAKNPTVRCIAATALGRMGEEAFPFVEVLARVQCRDTDEAACKAAMHALIDIEQAAAQSSVRGEQAVMLSANFVEECVTLLVAEVNSIRHNDEESKRRQVAKSKRAPLFCRFWPSRGPA
eukprot:TRINITY_DN36714_c0_g1_i1.p1 TRINITY_DN36714_c0_g1~~TRINITY_DN36714_c0_g1_i1.p1  ORF type:complete len:601 (-),score=118.70 TRINITY_DN36714_c0_g1_i1:413-2215(-)